MMNIRFLASVVLLHLFAACTFSEDFWLVHQESGKELGPYLCSHGMEITVANASFTIIREEESSFSLKHHETGRILGPFHYATSARVMLGETEFRIRRAADSASPKEDSGAKYPGLPVLDSSHLLIIRPELEKKILGATMASIEKNLWQEHLAAIEKAIFQITDVSSPLHRRHTYEKVISQPIISTMLMQSRLIRKVSPARLARLTGESGQRDFLKWLLLNRVAMESFLASVKPADNITRVLEIWSRLWNGDPSHRDAYQNLALACALVFDSQEDGGSGGYGNEDKKMSADQIYANFRDADMARRLKTDLKSLPAQDLVWVVDLEISAEEIDWARKKIRLSRRNWSRAYSMIEYVMEKAVDGVSLYEKYRIEEIYEKGGICGDQAYFAAMTAKAHGIPSMYIVGIGQRGGHAWFGYKETDRDWNIEAGRYTSDNFAAGTTVMKQTGKELKEYEIMLLTDPQRRTAGYSQSTRLAWLADIFMTSGMYEETKLALDMALEISSRHPLAWDLYFGYLEISNAYLGETQVALNKMRRAFRNHPDMIAVADRRELDAAIKERGPRKAAEIAGLQVSAMARLMKDRADLITAAVLREAKLLEQAGALDETRTVYRKALRNWGDRPAAFRDIASAYFAFAGRHDQKEVAAKDVEKNFERNYSLAQDDYFASINYVNLLELVMRFNSDAGNIRAAEKNRGDIREIRERIARNHSSN